MGTRIVLYMIVVLSIISCNKDDENIDTNIQGNYNGIFERNGNSSNVELTFNNGNWAGESDIVKFPALCSGTYAISGNKIAFENSCFWTAEFDWSLILSDDWNYNLNENSLILTKTNGDKYTLTKQ